MEKELSMHNNRLGATLDKIEDAFITVASIAIALSPLLVLL